MNMKIKPSLVNSIFKTDSPPHQRVLKVNQRLSPRIERLNHDRQNTTKRCLWRTEFCLGDLWKHSKLLLKFAKQVLRVEAQSEGEGPIE